MTTRIDVAHLGLAAQQAHEWLKDLANRAPFQTEEQAYAFLRAVLHALRDGLGLDEAVQLASQLPLMMKGVYYEGWKPLRMSPSAPTQHEFFHVVEMNLGGTLPVAQVDTMAATKAVLEFLADHVDPDELERVKLQLPKELQTMIATGVAA